MTELHAPGAAYVDAIAERLFTPLKMTATTAHQPPEAALAINRATRYAWDGNAYHPLSFRYTQSRPAGAVSTTAADMSVHAGTARRRLI